MKVFLAGRIAVEAEGVVIDERHFPGRQGRLLFAYLVAQQGRPVPREELADVLWGDAPPATWDKALSVLVSKLRAVLGESGVDGATALTAAFGCYQLDLPVGTWVDVLVAESAAMEAEGLLETNEPQHATASAALAESLTRSPFLPGDDGPWVDEKRRELGEVRTRALSALAEASLRTDKPAEAARWAELAVDAEPFRESGYRRLMEAHVAAGNRAEALRVYERCRRLLAEELGAYPSPETESIYRSLLEAPAGRAAAESPDATSTAGRAAPPAGRRKLRCLDGGRARPRGARCSRDRDRGRGNARRRNEKHCPPCRRPGSRSSCRDRRLLPTIPRPRTRTPSSARRPRTAFNTDGAGRSRQAAFGTASASARPSATLDSCSSPASSWEPSSCASSLGTLGHGSSSSTPTPSIPTGPSTTR